MNTKQKFLFLGALVDGTCSVAAQTWTQINAPSNIWSSIASSADGSKLAATAFAGGIYTSTNSGASTKATSAPATWWTSVASSADGNILIAAVGQGTGAPVATQVAPALVET